MELIVLLGVLAVIGLALWWPRSAQELAERERALNEWRQAQDVREPPGSPDREPPP